MDVSTGREKQTNQQKHIPAVKRHVYHYPISVPENWTKYKVEWDEVCRDLSFARNQAWNKQQVFTQENSGEY